MTRGARWAGAAAAAVALVAVSCSAKEAGSEGPALGEAPGASTTAAPTTEATTTTAPPEPIDDQTSPPTINGLTVDGGTLWIASIAGDEVLQVRIDDGAILARFPTGGAGPDDVAVAPDGAVWVTGFGNGDIGRIRDGEYEVVTTLAPGVNPVAVTDDGTVFVGTFGPNGDLFRIDPEPSTAAEAFTEVADGTMPDINGFGVLDDGRIFAPAGGLGGPGSAIAIDPETGTFETIVGDLPPVAAGTVDAEGDGYLLANITGEVIRVDLEAGTSEVVRTVSEGAPFDNLAFADDGTLYLSSFTTPTVTEVDPDGTTRVIEVGSAG